MQHLEIIPTAFLVFGLIFDLMSLAALVSTLVSGKDSSGFPGIGLVSYALYMLCVLIPPLRGRIPLGTALLIGVALIVGHLAMHWTHGRVAARLRALRKDD